METRQGCSLKLPKGSGVLPTLGTVGELVVPVPVPVPVPGIDDDDDDGERISGARYRGRYQPGTLLRTGILQLCDSGVH